MKRYTITLGISIFLSLVHSNGETWGIFFYIIYLWLSFYEADKAHEADFYFYGIIYFALPALMSVLFNTEFFHNFALIAFLEALCITGKKVLGRVLYSKRRQMW